MCPDIFHALYFVLAKCVAEPRRDPRAVLRSTPARMKGQDMHQFRNDYSEGAAPEMLEALISTNDEQAPGYGTDSHCEHAAELIREACGQPDAFVQFIPGGTAANAVCISAFTEDFEGPILAADAHPTAHETGAIEACGRRILATNDALGVLTPAEVERVYHASIAGGCHCTRPAMLYFSNTSELGHVYTRAEFDALCDVAEKLDLAVYVDGARMASALAAPGGDLTLEHLAARADAFTLGGTKAGMLFGEALVVSPRSKRGRRAIDRIPYLTKRGGHMTAKGRLMGVQYTAAFTRGKDGSLPYFAHAASANECACMLARGLENAGFEPYVRTNGNQQFFWFDSDDAVRIVEACGAEVTSAVDPAGRDRILLRFVTSWACRPEHVNELLEFVRGL